MKKILLLLSFFLPIYTFAYYGDVQNFNIEENSICLNAPEVASQSYISTESTISRNAQWSVEISLAFSPTSSNYLKWFVMADSSRVNTSTSGYYLLFGGSKRTISFYVLKSGKSTLVHEEKEMLLNNSQNNKTTHLRSLYPGCVIFYIIFIQKNIPRLPIIFGQKSYTFKGIYNSSE